MVGALFTWPSHTNCFLCWIPDKTLSTWFTIKSGVVGLVRSTQSRCHITVETAVEVTKEGTNRCGTNMCGRGGRGEKKSKTKTPAENICHIFLCWEAGMMIECDRGSVISKQKSNWRSGNSPSCQFCHRRQSGIQLPTTFKGSWIIHLSLYLHV